MGVTSSSRGSLRRHTEPPYPPAGRPPGLDVVPHHGASRFVPGGEAQREGVEDELAGFVDENYAAPPVGRTARGVTDAASLQPHEIRFVVPYDPVLA